MLCHSFTKLSGAIANFVINLDNKHIKFKNTNIQDFHMKNIFVHEIYQFLQHVNHREFKLSGHDQKEDFE